MDERKLLLTNLMTESSHYDQMIKLLKNQIELASKDKENICK